MEMPAVALPLNGAANAPPHQAYVEDYASIDEVLSSPDETTHVYRHDINKYSKPNSATFVEVPLTHQGKGDATNNPQVAHGKVNNSQTYRGGLTNGGYGYGGSIRNRVTYSPIGTSTVIYGDVFESELLVNVTSNRMLPIPMEGPLSEAAWNADVLAPLYNVAATRYNILTPLYNPMGTYAHTDPSLRYEYVSSTQEVQNVIFDNANKFREHCVPDVHLNTYRVHAAQPTRDIFCEMPEGTELVSSWSRTQSFWPAIVNKP